MYWPSECDRQVTYGSVEVTMTEVIPLADYTIRSMSIMKVMIICVFVEFIVISYVAMATTTGWGPEGVPHCKAVSFHILA